MGKKIDKERLLQSNPHIDPKEVEAALALVRAAESLGVKKHTYNLARPFSRRLYAGRNPDRDPRTVHLGR